MPPSHWTVESVASLSVQEKALLYLGSQRVEGASAKSIESRVREFLDDPTLSDLGLVESEWFAGYAKILFDSPRELVELQVLVCRNLAFQKLRIDRRNVALEIRRIREVRRQLERVQLFQQRDVLFAASHDTLRGSKRPMFGRETTQRQLQRRAGDFVFLQPDAPSQRGRQGHSELARALRSASTTTLYFEGHGRPTAVQFDGKLSAKKLAAMLAEAGAEMPIVIASSCQSHGFVRAVLAELQRIAPERRLPIMIVPEEFGQDFVTDAFNDSFKTRELGLSEGDDTLGHLFATANVSTSVYVPDDENRPMQIL